MIDKKGVIISKKDYLDISGFILKALTTYSNRDIKQAVMEGWPHLDLNPTSLGDRIRKLRKMLGATPLTDKQIEVLLDKFSRRYNSARGANLRLREKKQPGVKPKSQSKPEVEAERKKEYVDLRTKTAKMLSVKVGDIGKKWASC